MGKYDFILIIFVLNMTWDINFSILHTCENTKSTKIIITSIQYFRILEVMGELLITVTDMVTVNILNYTFCTLSYGLF